MDEDIPPRTQRPASIRPQGTPAALLRLGVAVLLLSWWGASAATAATVADFVINEVMLRNDTWTAPAFLDEDGVRSGWVELKNASGVAASIAGWSLADDPAEAGEFVLPDVSVSPGETLLVWLSGKNRAVAGSPLHAGFMAPPDAGIHLFDPQGRLVDSVVGQPIPIDHSLGRCAENDVAGPAYYYEKPSPGQENRYLGATPFVFAQSHVSLTVGQPHQLEVWPDVDVTWSSNNPNVAVGSDGVISAAADAMAPDGRATVTASLVGSAYGASIGVTIVPWVANVSSLRLVPIDLADRVLGSDGTGVHFSIGTTLYHAATVEAGATAVGVLPALPTSTSRLLVTPFGRFFNVDARVYFSQDSSTWSLAVTLQSPGLWQMFDAHWDAPTQTGHVFVGEYSSNDPTRRHRVLRGTYPPVGPPVWEVVLDLPSLADWLTDPGETEAVRHIHVVAVDPFTGDLFVGTGDADEHSRIYHSRDFGSTFQMLGMGEQHWRTVAIWFTERFVYWSMDTSAAQSVWRIPRTACDPVAGWPSLTPELFSGTSTPGVRYYVTEDAAPGRFPVEKGELFVETVARPLDGDHRLRAIDDEAFDYRQEVALLDNGAHWYQGFVSSQQGDVVSLVAAEPGSSFRRDQRARLFGIKESASGDPLVQELTVVRPAANNPSSALTHVYPQAQDAAGRIFFASRQSAHERYVGRLDWYGDAGVMPAAPAPPPPPPACMPVPEPRVSVLWAFGLLLLHRIQRRRTRAGQGSHQLAR